MKTEIVWHKCRTFPTNFSGAVAVFITEGDTHLLALWLNSECQGWQLYKIRPNTRTWPATRWLAEGDSSMDDESACKWATRQIKRLAKAKPKPNQGEEQPSVEIGEKESGEGKSAPIQGEQQ